MSSTPYLPMCQIFLFMSAGLHLGSSSPVHQENSVGTNIIDYSCESHVTSCRQSSLSSCTSLRNALINTYDVSYGLRLYEDTPYQIFSIFDLFYSGLIESSSTPKTDAKSTEDLELVRSMARERCADLLEQVKLSTRDADECQWSYTCKYNPHYFPSFTVEAKLDDSSPVPDRCQKISINNIKFVRTTCKANPEEDHWCRCDAGHITTGYKTLQLN